MTKKNCPLGEDCDLTLAWMMGAEDARDKTKAQIAALEAENNRLKEQCKGLAQAAMNNGQGLIIAESKLAKAVEALQSVINACDQGRMIPRPGHGAGGMTIEANVKGSIYTGVPAWPIEEARTALAELKGDKP